MRAWLPCFHLAGMPGSYATERSIRFEYRMRPERIAALQAHRTTAIVACGWNKLSPYKGGAPSTGERWRQR